MVLTFKSESCELLNLLQDSLGGCDRLTRVDWIRNFCSFTIVESFGFLNTRIERVVS